VPQPAIDFLSCQEIRFRSARFLTGNPFGLMAALERSREAPTRLRLNGDGGSRVTGEVPIALEPIEQLISVEKVRCNSE
jgi:hypothetical protein